MGESGNTWELVKSNDLGPTKGGLYKGMGANGERVVFLGFEREKRREGNKERERENRNKRGKHNGDEITKRAEKVRSNIKREEAIELETTRILEVGRSRLCLKQILYDFKEAHQQINLEPKSIVLKSNVHRFGVPQIDISSIKCLNFKFLSLKLCIKNKFMDQMVNNN